VDSNDGLPRYKFWLGGRRCWALEVTLGIEEKETTGRDSASKINEMCVKKDVQQVHRFLPWCLVSAPFLVGELERQVVGCQTCRISSCYRGEGPSDEP
jgi:hypothetical protein